MLVYQKRTIETIPVMPTCTVSVVHRLAAVSKILWPLCKWSKDPPMHECECVIHSGRVLGVSLYSGAWTSNIWCVANDKPFSWRVKLMHSSTPLYYNRWQAPMRSSSFRLHYYVAKLSCKDLFINKIKMIIIIWDR